MCIGTGCRRNWPRPGYLRYVAPSPVWELLLELTPHPIADRLQHMLVTDADDEVAICETAKELMEDIPSERARVLEMAMSQDHLGSTRIPGLSGVTSLRRLPPVVS